MKKDIVGITVIILQKRKLDHKDITIIPYYAITQNFMDNPKLGPSVSQCETQGCFPKLTAESIPVWAFPQYWGIRQQFNNTCKAEPVIILKNTVTHVIWSPRSLSI